MRKNETLKDVKKKITGLLDIAQLYSEMIEEDLIHPDAITNPQLKDENNDVHIDFEFDLEENLKNRIGIVCPFHDTKNNDSTFLYRETGTMKCYAGGCATQGRVVNIIDFYMMLKFGIKFSLLTHEDSMPAFTSSLRELAQRVGISFEYEKRRLSKEEIEEQTTLRIRQKASDLYHWMYKKHRDGRRAQQYMLETRGFRYGHVPFDTLVQRFKMGYAPGSFGSTWLVDRLKKDGFTEEEIERSGVAYRYKGKLQDLLTNGVVLPYFSKNRVNNLYSRAITNKKSMRHLRLSGSVDIPIHFDVAKQHPFIILLEGEFSWLTWIAMGYEQAVGNRGTNGLSKEHVELMKQEREKDPSRIQIVYLCYDGDKEGQAALEITANRLIGEGFDVRVIQMPHGDPNDLLQQEKEGAKAVFDRLLEEAISYEAWKILYLLRGEALQSTKDMVGALKRVSPYVEKVPKDQLFFIAYEVADIVSSSLSLSSSYIAEYLHRAWIPGSSEVHQPNDEWKTAVAESWVFAVDNPTLYEKLQQTEVRKRAVDMSQVDTAEFIQEMKAHSPTLKVVCNSTMDRATQQQLRSAGFKTVIFLEREEFTAKESLSLEEIKGSMVSYSAAPSS